MRKNKKFFWKKINRTISILSIDPYRISFFAGISKKSGEEQSVAIEIAKEFNYPDGLIWISFNKQEGKWEIIIEADDKNGVVRKTKKIFEKHIFPEMVKKFKKLLEQRLNEQKTSHLPVISNTLPIFGG